MLRDMTMMCMDGWMKLEGWKGGLVDSTGKAWSVGL